MWQRHLLPAAALPLQKLQNHRLLSKLPPKQMKLVEVYTRGKNAISFAAVEDWDSSHQKATPSFLQSYFNFLEMPPLHLLLTIQRWQQLDLVSAGANDLQRQQWRQLGSETPTAMRGKGWMGWIGCTLGFECAVFNCNYPAVAVDKFTLKCGTLRSWFEESAQQKTQIWQLKPGCERVGYRMQQKSKSSQTKSGARIKQGQAWQGNKGDSPIRKWRDCWAMWPRVKHDEHITHDSAVHACSDSSCLHIFGCIFSRGFCCFGSRDPYLSHLMSQSVASWLKSPST